MNARGGNRIYIPIFLFILLGCLESYEPPVSQSEGTVLVVDGFINATDNSAIVTLSYTAPLNTDEPGAMESNAEVVIEENGGGSYTLTGDGDGNYTVDGMSIDPAKTYRLQISLFNTEYVSDFITITSSPAIDTLSWAAEGNGVVVSVNSHDQENKSRYYRWNFEETWEYEASFFSTYKMVDGEALERSPDDRIYTCWSSASSTKILIGSSVRLAEDVISEFPLTFVPGNSIKLSRRYSILVEQRTLTPEAYDFWLLLQKTTESLGGLFDPLPAQLQGNIKSSFTNEQVLGYFSGGQVSRQRIFINYPDLPDELLALREKAPCQMEDIKSIPVQDIPATPNSVLLIDPIYVSGVGIVGYTTAISRCIDCQLQGGSTKRPAYW